MGAQVTTLAFCFCNDSVRIKKAGTVSRFAEADPDLDCQENICLDHKDVSTVDHDIIWHLYLDSLEIPATSDRGQLLGVTWGLANSPFLWYWEASFCLAVSSLEFDIYVKWQRGYIYSVYSNLGESRSPTETKHLAP